MKKFEPLYCLDKTGKIRIYTLEVVYDENYIIKSGTGLIDGQLTYTTKKVTKGKNIGKKNETSVHEQALSEAQSSWNGKLLEGYKSRKDLEERIISLGTYNGVMTDVAISELFREAEIKYNTTPQWYPLPMLANHYVARRNKIRFPAIIQPKLNGLRCLAIFDADLGEVILYGRGGETYEVEYIKDILLPFFSSHQNVILDGELYLHGKRLQEISGAARKKSEVPDWLEYHVYDALLPGKITQMDRLLFLSKQYYVDLEQNSKGKIVVVNSEVVNTHEEVKTIHDRWVSLGFEGAMLRNPNALYEISFRSNNLLKVKSYIDEEFELIGCEYDQNKTIGSSFVFILRDNLKDTITFKARPTGTEAQKVAWFKNQDWRGSIITVRFQERSTEGVPLQGHVVHRDSELLTKIADANTNN